MKKFILVASVVIFVMASSLSFAEGHKGGGSASQGKEGQELSGAPFGHEDADDEEGKGNRKFDEKAPGAWSKDNVPGKDKPSSDKPSSDD